MNSFALACLISASAVSVSLNSQYDHPWKESATEDRDIYRSGLDAGVLAELKAANKISNGDDLENGPSNKLVVFDLPSQSEDSSDESASDADVAAGIPFEAIANIHPEEKLDVVILQIEEGFEALADHNKKAEDQEIEEAQEEQQSEIEEIMEEA